MTEWTVHMQWWEQESIEVSWDSFGYTVEGNAPGEFTITMDAKWLDVLIPGMKVTMKFDMYPMFIGRLGPMVNNSTDTVTFEGTDEWGGLIDKIIEFQAAGFTEIVGDKITEVEASLIIQRLFKTYTGKTKDDSEYDITSFVVPSITANKWNLKGTLADELVSIAESAAVSDAMIGYMIWIDGKKRVHFVPRGTGKLWKDQVQEIRDLTVNPDTIVNKVYFYGDRPPTLPNDRDEYTEANFTTGALWSDQGDSGGSVA